MAPDDDPGGGDAASGAPSPGVEASAGEGGDGAEDLDREAILRRRARFVASAMAGLVLGAACEPAPPQACLSPVPMDPPPSGVDAGAEPVASTGAPAPSASDAPPQPCLEVPPQPCLRYAPPPGPTAAPGSSASSGPQPLPTSTNPYPAPCLKVVRPPGAGGR